MLTIGSICAIGSVGAVGHGSSTWRVLYILLIGSVHHVGWFRITLHPNFGCFNVTRWFTKLAYTLSKDTWNRGGWAGDTRHRDACVFKYNSRYSIARERDTVPPRTKKSRRINSRSGYARAREDFVKITRLRANDYTEWDQRSCLCTKSFRRTLCLRLASSSASFFLLLHPLQGTRSAPSARTTQLIWCVRKRWKKRIIYVWGTI